MLITILLFILGISNNAENSLTRLLLIVVAIVLILLAILEVYASGFEYQVNSQEFTRYAFRIVAGTEIIISGLCIYALKRRTKSTD